MTTPSLRWRDGRHVFTRAPIVRSQFDVASIDDDTTARAFIEQHHYSRSYPAARERYGLYRLGELVGVVVFSQPTNDKSITKTFTLCGGRQKLPAADGADLGRLVLLDEIGANAESYFVARCFELLRPMGFRGAISFSDPVPRTTLDGRMVLAGHVGTVYQALNAVYLGRSCARTLRLLPDGTVLNPRTLQKIRKQEVGWMSAVASLEAMGAPALRDDPREWVRLIVPMVTRPLRHPGNHKYAWRFDRRVELPKQVLRYPKKVAA